MNDVSANNKRIVRNTALLYFRMFLSMAVTLYTSRVVLNTLGFVDFGIYNVVGGIVVLFSFLNNSMMTATQRFLNFELGRNDIDEVNRIFSMSMTVHICIAIFVIIFAETIGLWFLNSQLNIPAERMTAANWVYQFTILTFCAQIIRVPYNASIVAYENMSFYAYISITEVILKLLIVFSLVWFGFDKLILYAVLTFGVTLLVNLHYKLYCNKAFTTCDYKYFSDALLYKKLISFSGWSMFGGVANVGASEGVNILLNIFFGVAVNAAMGIANQVSAALYGFVSNFQIAFNPQLVKSYATNDKSYFMKLIFQSSKLSYFLMLFISLPVIINADFILQVWLGIVPVYTASFCRLIIVFLLIDAISAPLWMSVQATGEIKNYQILMGVMIASNLPLAYCVLKFGFAPDSVLLVRVLINLATFLARIVYLRKKIDLPARLYFRDVVAVALLVTVFTLPLPLIVNYYLTAWHGLIISTIVALFSTGLVIYIIGLKPNERVFLKATLLNKITR